MISARKLKTLNLNLQIINLYSKNMNEFLDNYSLIPGIDKEGRSLLSEVINDVINPGIFIFALILSFL